MVGKIDEKSDNFDVIVFAICKTRQPTVERNAHVNQPDEFYFPDFDNFDEDN